ncbi:MAG: hypothetical protein ACOC80_15915 [Petrotogales bacterium]
MPDCKAFMQMLYVYYRKNKSDTISNQMGAMTGVKPKFSSNRPKEYAKIDPNTKEIYDE